MTPIGLGLGSNIGDKAGHVRRAAQALAARGIVSDLVLSRLYRTAPWGAVAQDWFVNACAVGRSDLAPHALLAAVKALETELGRTATVRWGPRVIDIDILWYGDVALADSDLVLPHRELVNRAFVLVPLATLVPDQRIEGRTVADWAALRDDGSVVPLAGPSPAGAAT